MAADVAAVNKIPIIPQLLNTICRITGTGFAAIARVTEDRWITCTSQDTLSFGLKTGDELHIENTMCNEVRNSAQPIFIDNVATDPVYRSHPVPPMYGIGSYVSFPIYRKDGSFFGTLCAIDHKPAKVDTPEIRNTFELFADLISFHLNAIEEMDASEAKLKEEREVAELRDQFIAILGHDLKNPIATTRMSSEILLKYSKDETVLRHAGLIKATSYRMQSLIENILDFARGRLGEGITLNREYNNGSLKEVLQQVLDEVKNNSPERDIKIKMTLDNPVFLDKNRVAQLFSNLLSNADLHGAQDGPITVEATTDEDKFRLSVSNTGEKISEEAMKHLFQPFYRESVKPNKQGLGLGLFIASEIAKAHEGELKVNSTDEMTEFTLEIPLKKDVKEVSE